MDLTIVTFETGSYRFQVVAATQDEGERLLAKAWTKHAKQTGADPYFLRDNYDDVQAVTVSLGTVLRDGSPMRNL